MIKHPPDPDPNPGNDEYDGDGDTPKDALDVAWEKAKAKDPNPRWFEVKKTWVYGQNPIREYKVRIKG